MRGRPPQSKPNDPLKNYTITLNETLAAWVRDRYDTLSAGLRALIRAAQARERKDKH